MNKKFLTFGILIVVLVGVFVPSLHPANAQSTAKCYTSAGRETNLNQTRCADEISNGYYWSTNGQKPTPSSSATPTNPLYKACISAGGSQETCAAKNSDQTYNAKFDSQGNLKTAAEDTGLGGWIWKKFAQGIGYTLITISSLALLLSGWIFDEVVKFTIVNMATNLGGGPGGVGDAITNAWSVLRDIANMCFIFVLLFAAFKAMFDTNFGGFGKTVKDIIIVALLINFSLFFSKVVIDASNIVAVGFYNSITNNTATYDTQTTKGSSFEKTISAGYMNMLGLQTFFGANILSNPQLTEGSQILTVGIMTAVFMLITAVILLIAGVMFIARFVILIFIMILSPLALIAYIIPGQDDNFKKWKNALIDQSFFAPIFFALTWVVFKVGSSLIGVLDKKPGVEWSQITTNPSGVMPLIINYVLIMGFSIAALVISKTMASRTAGFKQISGGIGAAALGGAALAGRQTIGRGTKWAADSSWLRNASSSDKWYSGAARAGLWTANKGSKGTFDVRGIETIKKVPGLGDELGLLGKAGGKGGFSAAVDAKVKARAQYAKDVYGQTDAEKDKAKKLQEDYDIEKLADEKKIKEERLTKAKNGIKNAKTPEEKTRAQAYMQYITNRNKKNIFDEKEYHDEFNNKDIVKEYVKYAKAGERRQGAFAERIKKESPVLTSTGAVIGGALGSVVPVVGTTIGAGLGAWALKKAGEKIPMSHQGSKAAARKIREDSKGPSKEKKLADAYKDIADAAETETTTTATPEATPSATPTPSPATPPT